MAVVGDCAECNVSARGTELPAGIPISIATWIADDFR